MVTFPPAQIPQECRSECPGCSRHCGPGQRPRSLHCPLPCPNARPSRTIPAPMHELLIALLIFCMRIGDVSIGTLRAIYTIRGRRVLAMSLGVVESAIWLLAITKAVDLIKHNPWAMVGWACGFGAGTFSGITIEKWIAS